MQTTHHPLRGGVVLAASFVACFLWCFGSGLWLFDDPAVELLGMRQIQFRMTIWSPWNFMHKFSNTTLQHLNMWAVGAILAKPFTSSPMFLGERIGHYTIPKEMNEVGNWLTARLGLEG
ncbi:uncharacterized protein LOC108454504 [Gossypium arboreum]|uniref:uncharacterized protein LOC108454504 n=1 Tax=Gossypium arboreum TaxID=29729 RepID=UPI0022F17A79|nr:uncharacterized protein LOC108454504 [Gossypium arboreum]